MSRRQSVTRSYRIREFAGLAGVTVRALHHYDRIGLLKPRRTDTGYRVYRDEDLQTLEQIVALKFIGLPLKTIGTLLRRAPADLLQTLHAQRTILEDRRRFLEQAIQAIADVETSLRQGGSADAGLLARVIKVIDMQTRNDEWKTKYDALVSAKIERLKAMSPEARQELQQQWTGLFKEAEGLLSEDPASPRVQQLADRWVRLLEVFSGGTPIDPELLRTFGAAYKDPERSAAMSSAADTRVWDLIGKALAARR